MICTSTRYSTGPNYCMKVVSCIVLQVLYQPVPVHVSGIPLFSHTSAAGYAVLYLYQVSLCSPVHLQAGSSHDQVANPLQDQEAVPTYDLVVSTSYNQVANPPPGQVARTFYSQVADPSIDQVAASIHDYEAGPSDDNATDPPQS